jgi:hypothetical protein
LARCWCCCTALLTRFEPFNRPTAPGATQSARRRRSTPTPRSRSVAALRSPPSAPSAVPNPSPPETEETLRIWRAGQRIREEHHGGHRDGHYGVTDGPLWWSWDEHMGARSNQDDPSVASGIGQQMQFMLNPTPLLSLLHFHVVGNSQVAGRPTVTAHAKPRPAEMTSADLAVAVSPTAGGQVVVRKTDPNQTHPYSMTELLVKVNAKRNGRQLTTYDHQAMCWKGDLRNNMKYAWKHSNGTSYVWSGEAVRHLASLADERYDQARTEYNESLRARTPQGSKKSVPHP